MSAAPTTPGKVTLHIEPVLSKPLASMELSRLVEGTENFSGVIPMIVGSDEKCVALTGCGPNGLGNAQRLIACWNACEGLSTEQVEQINGLLPAKLAYQIMQRDREALLAALQQILACANVRIDDPRSAAFDAARAAVANATGQNSQAQASQHVLKAEAATPDATDRGAPAITSPDGGPMGAGQPAAAGPEGGASYCYSYDEERFSGDFDTEAEALAEAFNGSASYESAYVGVVRDPIEFFTPEGVGRDIFDRISEQLGEEVGEVAECFAMKPEELQALGGLVLDFIVTGPGFSCFGVKDVKCVDRSAWQEEQRRDTGTADMFASQEGGSV